MKTVNLQRGNQVRISAIFLTGAVLLAGCSIAPKYEKPSVAAPPAFKEMTPAQAGETDGWKTAEPQDSAIRGKWWEMFQQPELNALEEQITVTNNQTLAAAFQNFILAREVMKETRSGYFPTVSANANGTMSRSNLRFPTGSSSSSGGSNFGGTSGTAGRTVFNYSLPIDASWELDLWGSVRNSVKANALEAQATLGDLENMRLSIQGELAVDYFQLRELDS